MCDLHEQKLKWKNALNMKFSNTCIHKYLKTITNNLPPYSKVNEMVYISSILSANIYLYTDYKW